MDKSLTGLLRLSGYLINGLNRVLHSLGAAVRPGLDSTDCLVYLVGGGHCLLGQLAHLIGDYSETAAGITSPGSLNGRIQRQQIGLIRDIPDDGQNFSYPPGLNIQREHILLQPQRARLHALHA